MIKRQHVPAMCEALTLVENLRFAVGQLQELYNRHPELNDLQPKSFQEVIPTDLDEWYLALTKNVQDWKKELCQLIEL